VISDASPGRLRACLQLLFGPSLVVQELHPRTSGHTSHTTPATSATARAAATTRQTAAARRVLAQPVSLALRRGSSLGGTGTLA